MSRNLRNAGVVLALGSCLIILASTAVTMAQINPFGRAGTIDLNNDDLQLMNGAASKLGQENSAIGQTETWQNPKSGRSGSISLMETFQKYGLPCQKRRYVVDKTVKSQGSTYVMDLCRLPTGEWKLA